MGVPIKVVDWLTPPQSTSEPKSFFIWRYRVSVVLSGVVIVMGLFFGLLFTGVLTSFIPGLAQAGELAELKNSIEIQNSKIDMATAAPIGMQLSDWHERACILENAGEPMAALPWRTLIRDKHVTYRALAREDYSFLDCGLF